MLANVENSTEGLEAGILMGTKYKRTQSNKGRSDAWSPYPQGLFPWKPISLGLLPMLKLALALETQ